MSFGNKLVVLLIIGFALLAFGCLQEKQWGATPSPSPIILPSPSPSPTIEVTFEPTASPTRIPSPSPSAAASPSPSPAAFSCIVSANPASGVGPLDVIIFATFYNKPSSVTEALIKCNSTDAGLTSSISAQNGAGRTCHYPSVSSTTTHTASASAGGISCTTTVTINVNESQPPAISAVAASTTSSSAYITWTTDKSSDSKVEYGVSTSYGTNVSNSSETGVTSHHVNITGLAASTTFHYRVWSCSSTTVCGVSQDYTFTTTAGPDTTAPMVTLNSPADGSSSESLSQLFSFTPVDNGAFANCSLWVNTTSPWSAVQTITSVSNNTANSIAYTFAAQGSFIWNVRCFDAAGNDAFASGNRTLNIVTPSPSPEPSPSPSPEPSPSPSPEPSPSPSPEPSPSPSPSLAALVKIR